MKRGGLTVLDRAARVEGDWTAATASPLDTGRCAVPAALILVAAARPSLRPAAARMRLRRGILLPGLKSGPISEADRRARSEFTLDCARQRV